MGKVCCVFGARVRVGEVGECRKRWRSRGWFGGSVLTPTSPTSTASRPPHLPPSLLLCNLSSPPSAPLSLSLSPHSLPSPPPSPLPPLSLLPSPFPPNFSFPKKNFDVAGEARIPATGPVMFVCAPHANQFLDGIVVMKAVGRSDVGFLTAAATMRRKYVSGAGEAGRAQREGADAVRYFCATVALLCAMPCD